MQSRGYFKHMQIKIKFDKIQCRPEIPNLIKICVVVSGIILADRKDGFLCMRLLRVLFFAKDS
jgi:hypothetical protein